MKILEHIKKYVDEEEAKKIEQLILTKSKEIAKINNLSTQETYKSVSYDIIGKLSVENFDSNDDFFWNSKIYKDIQDKINKKILRIKIKPESTKGLYFCNKRVSGKICGSDEFYVWTAVTRSMDEGMTHFAQCNRCGGRIKS